MNKLSIVVATLLVIFSAFVSLGIGDFLSSRLFHRPAVVTGLFARLFQATEILGVATILLLAVDAFLVLKFGKH